MATYAHNLGMQTGSHLVEGSTLMPKWEDRSGIPIQTSKINLLPKNVPQDPTLAKGPLFDVGGTAPHVFNLHTMLYQRINDSEYFKCLYVFKTFEKVVDVIYEKVTYVEPWARGSQKQPSSAFCLLLKLFHLRLTELQVQELLDHPDSVYIRALGALYARYGAEPSDAWRWLGPYCDDLEVFSPGVNRNHELTFGEYCRKLLTEKEYYGTTLPRFPVSLERLLLARLIVLDEHVAAGAKAAQVLKKHPTLLRAGVTVEAVFDDDNLESEPLWLEGVIVKVEEPYEGAPDGTLPRYLVDFGPEKGSQTVRLGAIDLPEPPLTLAKSAETAPECKKKTKKKKKRSSEDSGDSDDDDGSRRRRRRRDRSSREESRHHRSRKGGGSSSRHRDDDSDGDRRSHKRRRDRRRDRSTSPHRSLSPHRSSSRRSRSRDADRTTSSSSKEDHHPKRRQHRGGPPPKEAKEEASASQDAAVQELLVKPRVPKRAGQSVFAGRDIMAELKAKERDAAVADSRGDVVRKPQGYNVALIMPNDRKLFGRSSSPPRTRVAPVMPTAPAPPKDDDGDDDDDGGAQAKKKGGSADAGPPTGPSSSSSSSGGAAPDLLLKARYGDASAGGAGGPRASE